ncbi:restriction endonuclease [Sporosarcina sp. HYO08]|uniref:restriction endonuclease n=1 Tax=Sporosarcina sp. HYO08 TaxID=1759557 RepID=UPI0007941D11|nr:restriction endonuclease [Sporosarcina sp. HYO08]KXH86090.1 hypothetical protein AU377_14705 [Sporosarcina sp. HYO08]
MFKFIKEATSAVATKNENLKFIEEMNDKLKLINEKFEERTKEVKALENKVQKINATIGEKQEVLQALKKQEGSKLVELHRLDQEIATLTERGQELSKINETMHKTIKQKEEKLEKLHREIKLVEEVEDPVLKQKKGIARLCSALQQIIEKKGDFDWQMEIDVNRPRRFYYPYQIDLNELYVDLQRKKNSPQKKKKKQPSKRIVPESKADKNAVTSLPEPTRDAALDELMERFSATYDCFVLVIPTVIDYLVQDIDNSNGSGHWASTVNRSYYDSKVAASALYKNHISVFFKLLTQKGYPIKGNERFYLTLLNEKALEQNYQALEDEFHPLLQLHLDSPTLEDVIYVFIKIVEGDQEQLKYLAFLKQFLVKEGFLENYFDLDDLYDLVKREFKKYEIIALEKELFKSQERANDQKVTVADIDLMSGEEFEHFLVELLQNLGFRAKITKASGDQGVDVLAKKQGKVYAIQAKRYAGSVGNKAVQEVASGKQYYGADVSWVITNSSFTQSAKNLAHKTHTLLWDGNKLKSMMELANLS